MPGCRRAGTTAWAARHGASGWCRSGPTRRWRRGGWSASRGGSLGAVEQHRVAERQEPVAVVERLAVEVLPARPDERLDQRQQRQPGHVEVGEEAIDHTEVVVAA